MRAWDALPNCPLVGAGAITAAFVRIGVTRYCDAARRVQALAYGRNRSRVDQLAVLHEGKGTCSTKHALLALLATEQMLPVALRLGIYQMNERNTPGVGKVLSRYGIASIPEAHCYLLYAGERVDLTRESSPHAGIRFLHEETIEPGQIGEYKRLVHRRFIGGWRVRTPGMDRLNLEQLWTIREECIGALSFR